MSELKRTIYYQTHVDAGATLVDFGGWEMPIQYPIGIIAEHLACRKNCAIFDVSHMGRVYVEGSQRVEFLQHVLSSNVGALEMNKAQYTIIPTTTGGAVDDAYVYRYEEDRHLLVINAGNIDKDMAYLNEQAKGYDVRLTNVSDKLAAVALQGPNAQKMLEQLANGAPVPCGSSKNLIGVLELDGRKVIASATGYTGEPIGYELYFNSEDAVYFWNRFVELGAVPAGLGARDTLRLEAALPLYGHEMGIDNYGNEIRLFSVPLASFAVKFAEEKGAYVGREVLEQQYADFLRQKEGDHTDCKALPLRIRPICLTGKGVLRAGFPVKKDGVEVGYVTSGTMVPYYVMENGVQTETVAKRSIGFALIREDIVAGDEISVDIRGREVAAVVVAKHINNRVPPVAIPVVYGE